MQCVSLYFFNSSSLFLWVYKQRFITNYLQKRNVYEGDNQIGEKKNKYSYEVKLLKSLAPPLMTALIAFSPIVNPPGNCAYCFFPLSTLYFYLKSWSSKIQKYCYPNIWYSHYYDSWFCFKILHNCVLFINCLYFSLFTNSALFFSFLSDLSF